MPYSSRRGLKITAFIIALIITDQATKYAIPSSHSSPHTPLYLSITIIIILWIWLYEAKGKHLIVPGLLLMIAGGTSNIIDQLIHKSVLDIINAGVLNFNMADVYIVLGSILITTTLVAKMLPRPSL